MPHPITWKREGNCIVCTSHTTRKWKYPEIYLRKIKKQVGIHILVCERRHGPRPRGQFALHSCGNFGCINPDHLRWGTPKDNTQDAISQGTTAIGERVGSHRITEDQVRELRQTTGSYRAIGRKFGISHTQARKVKLRIWWKHVT